MIQAVFKLGGDQLLIEVDGNNVMFCDVSDMQLTTIEGLRLDKGGVMKEFPDLKDNPDWRKEAIKRFKEHIKNMKTETERIDYVIMELSKFGYEPLYKRRKGFRPERIRRNG